MVLVYRDWFGRTNVHKFQMFQDALYPGEPVSYSLYLQPVSIGVIGCNISSDGKGYRGREPERRRRQNNYGR